MTRARDDRRESPFFPRISEGERSCEYRANLVSSLKRALQAWRFQLQMSHQLCTREPLSIQPSLRTEALECRHRYNHCMDGGSRQGPSIQPLYGRRLTPRPVHTTIVWTEAHAKARPYNHCMDGGSRQGPPTNLVWPLSQSTPNAIDILPSTNAAVETWHHVELLPGLKLLMSSKASAAARGAAKRICNEFLAGAG